MTPCTFIGQQPSCPRMGRGPSRAPGGWEDPCAHESMIPPLGLSVCKKCGDILLRSNCRDQRQEWQRLSGLDGKHDLRSDNLEIEMSHVVSMNDKS